MTITNKVSSKSVMGGNTPIPDVPDTPTIGTITNTSFDGSVTVAVNAAATGGTPTTFTITPDPSTSPSTFTGTSPVTVSGLTDGTSYTFTARGVNSTATGPASSASGSTAIVTAGSYYSIATTTVGAGGVSSITFSSIPQTYTHLQIRYTSRNAAATDTVLAQLNSDTGSNYAWHSLRGSGSAASSTAATSQTRLEMPWNAYSGTTANAFGTAVVDILDYTNTNKNTTVRSLGGAELNGSGYIFFESGLWMNTAAVSTVMIYPESGSFAQYSHFALYGVIA